MKGKVTLRVECLMPERLIQRCTAQGARFDGVSLSGDRTLLIDCDAASGRCVLTICERYGIPALVIRRRGVSALSSLLRDRPTLPLGFVLMAALCALFLSRLWLIDIAFTGQTASLGDRLTLARLLDSQGVRPGISRAIDPYLIAQMLQAGAGDYSYVGVRVQGVRLLVEAAPEVPSPAVYDIDAPRDLVCAMDGIVIRAIARSGELSVRSGDAVRRGQLLIRGEERSGAEETRPIAALGEVIVRTWFEGCATLPRSEGRFIDTGRACVGSELIGPGFEWPISDAVDYPSQRAEREYLAVGGLFVPLEIRRVTNHETRRIEQRIDMDMLKARLRKLALADAVTTLALNGPGNYSIERSWVDYEYGDGSLNARAVLEIQTDAAVTRETLRGGN